MEDKKKLKDEDIKIIKKYISKSVNISPPYSSNHYSIYKYRINKDYTLLIFEIIWLYWQLYIKELI